MHLESPPADDAAAERAVMAATAITYELDVAATATAILTQICPDETVAAKRVEETIISMFSRGALERVEAGVAVRFEHLAYEIRAQVRAKQWGFKWPRNAATLERETPEPWLPLAIFIGVWRDRGIPPRIGYQAAPRRGVKTMALQIVKPANPAQGSSSMPECSGECPDCQGSGFVVVPGEPDTVVKCACLVKREALQYLTPVYAAAAWDPSLDASALAGRNLLLEACRESVLKGFVKSFLLNYALAQRCSHLTVTPRGVMDAFFNPERRDREDHLYRVDYLFLLCGTEPRNSHYAPTLISLITARHRWQRPTSVCTREKLNSSTFTGTYGAEFAAFLTSAEAQFQPVRLKGGGLKL